MTQDRSLSSSQFQIDLAKANMSVEAMRDAVAALQTGIAMSSIDAAQLATKMENIVDELYSFKETVRGDGGIIARIAILETISTSSKEAVHDKFLSLKENVDEKFTEIKINLDEVSDKLGALRKELKEDDSKKEATSTARLNNLITAIGVIVSVIALISAVFISFNSSKQITLPSKPPNTFRERQQ